MADNIPVELVPPSRGEKEGGKEDRIGQDSITHSKPEPDLQSPAQPGKEAKVKPQLDVPPDGGYGWVCVACVFWINAHTWGINSVSFSSFFLLLFFGGCQLEADALDHKW